jgi:uncharacterized protein YgiB involved in biofilm formation
MRTSPVKLVLASSLPLALSACGPAEPTYTVTQQVNYESLEACVSDQVPAKDCEKAYGQAFNEYQRTAPIYDSLRECEAAFTPGGCLTTIGGRYMPRMNGFELETAGEVSESQLAKANNGQSNLSGSFATGVVAGMLLSQVLPADRRYRSQPLYAYNTGGSSYRNGLLGQRFAIQRAAREEQQGSSGGGSSGGGGGWSRERSGQPTSASISRGGFGSQATARGGWGGRSGSFFGG